MEAPIQDVSNSELRAVIRFLTAKDESVINIHRQLISGEQCLSMQMVRRLSEFINS